MNKIVGIIGCNNRLKHQRNSIKDYNIEIEENKKSKEEIIKSFKEILDMEISKNKK